MAKTRKKRKESDECDSVKTLKQNKKRLKPELIPVAVGETLSGAVHLQFLPVLPVDMNNSVFSAAASTPVNIQMHGQLS